jgi:predicted transcriptional regulator
MNGAVRFVTHGDLTDADIEAVLSRIGPIDRTLSA